MQFLLIRQSLVLPIVPKVCALVAACLAAIVVILENLMIIYFQQIELAS